MRRERINHIPPYHEQHRDDEEVRSGIDRRTLITAGGAGAAVVASGYGLTHVMDIGETVSGMFPKAETYGERQAHEERMRLLDGSPTFDEAVHEYVVTLTPDMPFVLRESREHRVQGMSCADYFGAHVFSEHEHGDLPESVWKELSYFIPGLPAVESRYDNTRVSDEDAFSRIQVLPHTLTERNELLKEERYTPENILLPEVQAQFMREVLSEGYRMLMASETTPDSNGWTGVADSLQTLADRHYAGNWKLMEQCFLIPCLLTSYQAGIGTIRNFILYARRNEVRAQGGGYDPFYAYADKVAELPLSEREQLHLSRFDETQSKHFFGRIFGFRLLFEADKNRQRRS